MKFQLLSVLALLGGASAFNAPAFTPRTSALQATATETKAFAKLPASVKP